MFSVDCAGDALYCCRSLLLMDPGAHFPSPLLLRRTNGHLNAYSCAQYQYLRAEQLFSVQGASVLKVSRLKPPLAVPKEQHQAYVSTQEGSTMGDDFQYLLSGHKQQWSNSCDNTPLAKGKSLASVRCKTS